MARRRLHVLCVHGIGGARPGFSDGLRVRVRRLLARDPRAREWGARHPDVDLLDWSEYVWSAIGEERELGLLQALYPDLAEDRPPRLLLWELIEGILGVGRMGETRRSLIKQLGDILVYLSPTDGERIRAGLASAITAIRDRCDREEPGVASYVTLIAYSLGAVIAFDVAYRFAQTGEMREHSEGLELGSLVTLGAPIALFSLLRGPAYDHYRDRPVRTRPGGRWVNCLDPQDLVAWPIRPLYPELPGLEDRPVRTGNLVSAHSGYWHSRDVARIVAGCLSADPGMSAGAAPESAT